MKTLILNPRLHRRRRAAFTLLELLALMVILALLMSLQLSALARAKGQTRATQCASNLRQFTQATIVYANENNDKLPDNTGGGNRAFDMSWGIGTQLTNYGATWKVLYCPGTAPRFTATDNFNLYNYVPERFRVVGYAMTFSGTASVVQTNWNSSLTPPTILVAPGTYLMPPAAKRVLLADVTISAPGQSSYAQRLTYNWTSIQGGFYIRSLSSHLNGTFPSGGNQSMLDGHVEWRDFDDLQCRTSGGSPCFWW